jgi:group I intron endonuclease
MSGVIYIVTNSLTGKQYVGLTKRPVSDRWKQHVRVAKNGAKTYFHRAIVKYGERAFFVEHVASAISLDALADLERQVILQVNPAYNQTNGGEITLGRKYDDATKERIRVANTGQKRTPEQCAAISAAVKVYYECNPDKLADATKRLLDARRDPESIKKHGAALSAAGIGRTHTEESRRKISLARMGLRHSAEVQAKIAAKNRKAIQCSDGRIFTCRKDAAIATNVSAASIWRVCAGKQNNVKGLGFSYLKGSTC